MPINITEPGGIVPRLNPERLPENCAQVAHNCDVTGGVLRPLVVEGEFVSLHETDGTLKAGLLASDVVSITKPTAPSVAALTYLADPTQWLRVIASDWVTYIDNTGTFIRTKARSQLCRIVHVWYSEADIYVTVFLPVRFYTFAYGGPYKLIGPRYQFGFNVATNGPDQQVALPPVTSEGDTEFVRGKVPLVDENQQIYSYFEVADVWGPNYDKTIPVTDYASVLWMVPGSYVTFRVNMNYTEPRRQHLYYVSAAMDAQEREGPPSEISAKIVRKPGMKLTLNVPRPSGYPLMCLYRAGTTNADDFRLVDDEVTTPQYTDWKESVTREIPPFGNYPGGNRAAFLRGSVLHPAHFGAGLSNGTLYFSDQYRLHAWPEEYALPFPGAKGLALAGGNTILVYCANEVYAVRGGNPAQMGKESLGKSHRLLNVAGIAQVGDTVYWPTDDGLAASNGGPIKIVTEGHYTRKQWKELKPEKMSARTADNSIFLEGGTVNLRFDFKEQTVSAVTTFDSLSGADYQWRSKRHYFDQPTIMDFVRVVADGPVTLKVYGDRKLVQTVTIDTDEPMALSSMQHTASTRRSWIEVGGSTEDASTANAVTHCREWTFEVIGDAVVRRIEAFERVIVDIDDEVNLTSDNTPVWRSTWVRFKDAQRFAVVQANLQTTIPTTVRLYADGVLVHTETRAHGRAFAVPRTVPKANLWTIDVESPVRIDSLYATRRRVVDAGDGIREINDGPFAPWLAKVYQFTDQRRVSSVIVHAGKRVRMNLYYDGAIDPSETVTVPDNGEVKVTLGQHNSVEFDFAGDDSHVREVIVFVTRVQAAGPSGITVVNPPSTRGLLFKFVDVAQLAVGSIGATDYTTLRVTLKADGTTVWDNQRVTSGRAFALPHTLPEASLWEIDITGGGEIHSVVFLPRTPEVMKGRSIRAVHPKAIPAWMHKRYTFALGATQLISAWAELQGETSIRMRFWLDGATAVSKTVTLRSRVETLVSIPDGCTTVDVDFNGEDANVVEFGLFGQEVGTGDMNGIETGPRMNWRKLPWRYVDRADMACAVVGARKYTGVKLRVLADGRQVRTGAVDDGQIIKLPRKPQDACLWEADIEAPEIGIVDRFTMIPRRSVQASGPLQRTKTGTIPPWLYERYEYAAQQRIRSVIVDADAYPVQMRLYYDKSTGISEQVTITSAKEVLVNSTRVHGCLEFDFVDDGPVRDVTVLPMSEELIGPDGITLQNPVSTRGLAYKFADIGAFAAGSVGASAYPVTMTLNGEEITVADGGMFFFPRTLEKASRWVIDIDPGSGQIFSVVLVPWVRVDADTVIREKRPEVGISPWMTRVYQYVDQAWPGAAIVHADEYPVTLRLFADGATEPTTEIAIENAGEVRLGALETINDLRFDFDGDDTQVREVILFTKKVEEITGGTPVLLSGPSFRRNFVRYSEPMSFACGLLTISEELRKTSPTQAVWDGSALLNLYADGILVHTERIKGPGVFVLPAGMTKGRVWEIDVETSLNVTGVQLFPWVREGFEGAAVRGIVGTGSIPKWLYTEYEMANVWRAKSAVSHADRAVPLDMYVDGASEAQRVMLEPLIESVFDAVEGRRFRFRVGEQSTFQRHGLIRPAGQSGTNVPYFAVFREETIAVENGGVILRPAQDVWAWRNKVLEFKDTGSWRVGRVVATEYPVTVRLYRGTTAVDEVEVTDGRPFKFAADLPNAKHWGLDVQTTGLVQEFVLISRDAIQLTDGAVRITKADDPFAWIGKRVMSARPVNFSACRVNASAYPVRVRMFDAENLGTDPVDTIKGVPVVDVLAHDGRPFRLPRLRPERNWEIDIDAPETTAIWDVAIGTSMDGVRA